MERIIYAENGQVITVVLPGGDEVIIIGNHVRRLKGKPSQAMKAREGKQP